MIYVDLSASHEAEDLRIWRMAAHDLVILFDIVEQSELVADLICVMLPIPPLPPQRLVDFAQSSLGLGGEAAYLLCVIAVQAAIYSVLGLSATFVVNRAQRLRGRLLQTAALPLVVVGLTLAICSLLAGQAPVWINAAVPVAACLGGVILGLGVSFAAISCGLPTLNCPKF